MNPSKLEQLLSFEAQNVADKNDLNLILKKQMNELPKMRVDGHSPLAGDHGNSTGGGQHSCIKISTSDQVR
ncbi:MAG: hypothetical protein CMM07_19870 [Rhodopirellula sp.]|nr:hypothetical protein [Rhodopirellula sp.]